MQTAFTAAHSNPFDDELPPIQPVPPLITAVDALPEKDYERVYRNLVRAIVHRQSVEISPEDRTLLLAGAKSLFRNRSTTLTEETMSSIETSILREPTPPTVTVLCNEFMMTLCDPSAMEEYRAPENWRSKEARKTFETTTTTMVQQRLQSANRTMGNDDVRRKRSTQIFESIRSGAAMSSGQTNAPIGIRSEFTPGCFGNVLNVELQHIIWRKIDADGEHKTYGMTSSFGGKLQVSVQLIIDGQPKHEVVVRGLATEVSADPSVEYTDGTTVEVPSIGTARYWRFREGTQVSLSIGGGYITASNTQLAIYVRRPKRLACFAFEDVAQVTVPLTTLYTDIMPLGDATRATREVGYHFTNNQHVDKVTGIGVGVGLEMKCFDTSHWEKPYFFDPTEPQAADGEARRLIVALKDSFAFPHHSALLLMFEMAQQFTDVEFELFEAYRDFYFLDPELFEMATCLARAKNPNVQDVSDLADALRAVEIVAERQNDVHTHTTARLIGDALPAIRNRFTELLCEVEAYTTPSQGRLSVIVAQKILRCLGMESNAVSSIIHDMVTRDLSEKTKRIETTFRGESQLQGRATATFTLFNQELGCIGRSMTYLRASVKASKNDNVEGISLLYALAAHRIACQLEVLSPFVHRFVAETIQVLVHRGEKADPVGETFCILCSMQQRAIDCLEVTKNLRGVKEQVLDLASAFSSFLSVYLSLARPRMMFCMAESTRVVPLSRISSRCLYCQAPADAVSLLSEVIDFFWQCAACTDLATLTPCLPPFADLICVLIDEFSKNFTKRVVSGQQRKGVRIGQILEEQMIGMASFDEFATLLDEIVENAQAPTKELGSEDESLMAMIKTCEAMLDAALRRTRQAVKAFCATYVAGGFASTYFGQELKHVTTEGQSALDGVVRRLNDFWTTLCQCAEVDGAVSKQSPVLVKAWCTVLCTAASQLDDKGSRSAVPQMLDAINSHVQEWAATIRLDQRLLSECVEAFTMCDKVLQELREPTDVLITIIMSQTGELKAFTGNILCARGDKDPVAKHYVQAHKVTMSRPNTYTTTA
jgi:hypothetical protein